MTAPVPPAGVMSGLPTQDDRVDERWRSARWFALVGSAAVVAGGLVAGLSRPTGAELGPWTASFLVLVVGVAQIVLGVGQAWVAVEPPSRQRSLIELVGWNAAAAVTIVGTLTSTVVLTVLGSAATAVVAVVFMGGIGPASRSRGRGVRAAYLTFAVLLLLSSVIGAGLGMVRQQ